MDKNYPASTTVRAYDKLGQLLIYPQQQTLTFINKLSQIDVRKNKENKSTWKYQCYLSNHRKKVELI
jgi:hypothetical protein